MKLYCLGLLCLWLSIALPACTTPTKVNVSADRDMAINWLMDDLRQEYGQQAISTLSVESPRGHDLGDIVRSFADASGLQISSKSTNIKLQFLLELTTGYFTGPHVKNYYLHANLLLKDDQSGGWEMIKTRTEKFRCDQLPEEKAKLSACSRIIPLRASDILYKLSDP